MLVTSFQHSGASPSAAPAPPTPCHAAVSGDVASLAGRRIGVVHVITHAPVGILAALAPAVHVTTREATIRSALLFGVGDRIDTLRVAESVRQLRRLRYLAGADVTGACDSAGDAILTVETRDRWSMIPRLTVDRSASTVVGIEETNLLGTGRDGRVYARSDRGQLGLGTAYSDPSLFSSRVIATLRHDIYNDGRASSVSLRSREDGAFARTGFSLDAQRSSRHSIRRTADGAPGDTVRRANVSVLFRQRLSAASADGVTFLIAGAEAERAMLSASADLAIAGPPVVRRSFAGLDVGLSRRVGKYSVVRWLLPSVGADDARLTPAEIPIGLEWEGVVSGGHDFAARRPAARADFWVGRIWSVDRRQTMPATSDTAGRGALISADLWTSGYRYVGAPGTEWQAGALRAAVEFVAPAARGLWSAQLAAERLLDPDPDVRGLHIIDRVQRALPQGTRLAETAVIGSVERAVPLLAARRGYALAGAAFIAASARWDVAVPLPISLRSAGGEMDGEDIPVASALERVYAGYVGLGLRLEPTRFGQPTLGVDFGLPVVRGAQVAGRPYFALTAKSAFGWGRGRRSPNP